VPQFHKTIPEKNYTY